eukprot:11163264-Lingulodinium_polyedra.AAC.1
MGWTAVPNWRQSSAARERWPGRRARGGHGRDEWGPDLSRGGRWHGVRGRGGEVRGELFGRAAWLGAAPPA